MALLERVATLVRANLNDLIDRAEHPEKMLKQVIVDMQNQFIQVKTQVAIAIADLHLLEKKKTENDASCSEWMRKAELAVDKKDDALARAALARSMSYKQLTQNFDEQIADQKMQVETLKDALRSLEQKLAEAQAKSDLLIAQHRRAKAVSRAADAHGVTGAPSQVAAFDRMKNRIDREHAIGQAKVEMMADDVERKFAALERDDEIERLLQDIKSRKSLPA